jgi:hypothetical protein
VETVTFRQLPTVAKVAVGIAFLEAWVSLEQLVIEPTGLWHYMPFYRVGGFFLRSPSSLSPDSAVVTAGTLQFVGIKNNVIYGNTG